MHSLWLVVLTIFLVGCGPRLTAPPHPSVEPAPSATPVAPLRVLFIGNSYTFYNAMPETFVALVRSAGREVEVGMAAQHAGTFEAHAASTVTLALLDEGWDYVVLQEQSLVPAHAERREVHMYPAARELHARVSEAGAETLLYMTWGRRDGLPTEGFADFESMQAALVAGYADLGETLGIRVAPVGLAWQRARSELPGLELYHNDSSHPSPRGSYLVACVFYAVITGESPEGLAYTAGLPEDTAYSLQRVAAEAVQEALE